MPFFKIDLVNGKLPAWVDHFVSVTRPLAVNALIAIPTIGAVTCALVAAFFGEPKAMAMVRVSIAFLTGIPDALYGLIGGSFLAYTGAKSWEAVRTSPPDSGTPSSPEQGGSTSAGPEARAAVAAAAPPDYDISQE